MDLKENHREPELESIFTKRPAWQQRNLSQNQRFTKVQNKKYTNYKKRTHIKVYHSLICSILSVVTFTSAWILCNLYSTNSSQIVTLVVLTVTSSFTLCGISFLIWWFIFIDWNTVERDPVLLLRKGFD